MFISISARHGCCFLSLSKASALCALLGKRKIITAVAARVTRQLNAAALVAVFKLMLAEAEGRGAGLVNGNKKTDERQLNVAV